MHSCIITSQMYRLKQREQTCFEQHDCRLLESLLDILKLLEKTRIYLKKYGTE